MLEDGWESRWKKVSDGILTVHADAEQTDVITLMKQFWYDNEIGNHGFDNYTSKHRILWQGTHNELEELMDDADMSEEAIKRGRMEVFCGFTFTKEENDNGN